MKTIIVVGIPGSGKSSILQETIRQIPSLELANYGDKMLEETASEGISRDALRKMDIEKQQKIGIKAAQRIMQKKVPLLLIDTHALIRTEIGYCPGLPREVLEILSPKALVLVECSPTLILQRRKKDQSRSRDKETEEALQMHQVLMRSYLTSCCMFISTILCPIQNNGPSITENAQTLIQLINSLNLN